MLADLNNPKYPSSYILQKNQICGLFQDILEVINVFMRFI